MRHRRFSGIALVAPVVAAAWLVWVDIGRVGLGNTYYATAVRSMLTGPHALVFASFDPAGFVSVDKPPLGLWLQAASAALFGFSGPALILPSAVAAVLSVAFVGMAVRAGSEAAAGLVAAAALAVTPVSVVVARDNLLDGPLVALCLLAASAAFVATRTTQPWPLLLAALCVGLAFNVKFLDAYLVVPAIATAFLLGAPGSWRRRASVLAAAGVVLLAVSAVWVTFVDLTPADQRPYVGSTHSDSAVELAIGYDGLQRLLGHSPTAPAAITATAGASPSSAGPLEPAASDAGAPGVVRLLEPQLGGQVGWFVPLAIVGLASGLVRLPWRAWRRRRRPPLARHQVFTLLFGGWFLTGAAFFSVAGFFSPYYLAVLAPPVAALAGDGAVAAWRAYWRAGWPAWLLPFALLASGAEAWLILAAQPDWLPWLGPAAVLAAAIGSLGLALGLVLRLRPHAPGRQLPRSARGLRLFVALALAVVIGTPPLLWTLDSLRAANEGSHPLAGPSRSGPVADEVPRVSPSLVQYLVEHAGGARFLVATLDTATATPFILATGQAAMALGGFSGHDPILIPATLAADVARGVVRYAYLPTGDLTAAQQRGLYPDLLAPVVHRDDGQLASWIDRTCTPLPLAAWSPTTTHTARPLSHELFDCASS
jgi:4-amino-4-deoxy-L-arabinose transferase-like glycosyltransferase